MSEQLLDKHDGMPRVVGIGASAGGLDALKEFLGAMPAESGMAFVIIQHLDPTHESRMAEILDRSTAMDVMQAEDGKAVEPNTVYTNPPGRTLSIQDGRLSLGDPTKGAHVETAIDHFLNSLAEDQGSRAVCIILSGSSGLDGPRGVRAVRAAGGMCMVQEPDSAQFPAMPQAIIDTGLVDYVLKPANMPAALVEFAEHPAILAAGREEPAGEVAATDIDAILKLLRTRTNSDYSHYKRATVLRRIQRRMGLRQVNDTSGYVKLLQADTAELAQLAKDMLIGVSSFFRDAEVFESLRTEVLVPLIAAKDDDSPLRVWVAGCATGEEAYSISMLLLEERSAAGKAFPVLVFATDVDESALEAARTGQYPPEIADHLSPDRLERFFTKSDKGYRVEKHLRDTVIFSRHNLLADPPFSKLDLISCRNVMIYLEPAAQKKVLSVFSFALNTGCYLLLGKSEGIAGMDDLFEPIAKQDRIFRLVRPNRKAAGGFPLYAIGQQVSRPQRERSTGDTGILPQANLDALLRHFDASVVLIDAEGKILYFHGRTEKYLGHPKGPASLNILDMTGGSLSARLRRAIKRAIQKEEPVRLAQVPMPKEGSPLTNLTVLRMGDRADGSRLLAVVFEDARVSQPSPASHAARAEDEPLVSQLEAEVKTLRTELRTNVEGYDAATEELKAANEEVMSMNEELQSANEEMEASKEELQSVNEELTTVNAQLNDKLGELTQANNDLANLLMATEIATIFLDTQLRIRRFTPRAKELLNVIESDLGRPVGHITQNFTGIDLAADAGNVLKGLSPVEKEVRARDGCWYTVRILPYRTVDNRIDGTVITFSDVTRLKEIESHLRYEKSYTQDIVDTVHNPLIVLDDDLRVISANPAFLRVFNVKADETVGQKLYDLGSRQWDIPELRDVLQRVADQWQQLDDFEVRHEFPAIGLRIMLLNARRIVGTDALPHRILLSIADITDRRQGEVELQRLAQSLARSNQELEQFAYVVSHDLQEPLRMIAGFLDLLRHRLGDRLDEKAQEYATFVVEGVGRMQAMIKDLLDFSRVGVDSSARTDTDLAAPLNVAIENLRTSIELSGANVTHTPLPTVIGNRTQLARLFQNLIGNAIKFRGEEPPKIHIAASQSPEGWLISLSDNGIGIAPQDADRVFRIFQRLHTREEYEGTGIGLAICRRIVEQHGGRIWLESGPGKGTTFYFTLPAGGSPTDHRRQQ